MPMLFIHVRNSEYVSRDDGAEHDTPQTALAAGIRSAVSMAADEVDRGKSNTAVVVNVEQEDGTRLLSSVVAVSVSPLMVAEANIGLDA